MRQASNIRRFDWVLIGNVIFLCVVGIVNIYSSSHSYAGSSAMPLYYKQMLWVLIGLVLMVIVSMISYNLIGYYALYIYIGGIVLLIFTLLFAAPINNAKRWLNLGLFKFQTSEFMKLAFIIVLGKYMDIRGRDIRNIRELVTTSLILVVPFMLVLLQPDLGTGLSLIPIFMIMLFVGGANYAHLFAIVAIGLITISLPLVSSYYQMTGQTLKMNPSFAWLLDNSFVLGTSAVLLFSAVVLYLLRILFSWKFVNRYSFFASVLSLGLFFSELVSRYFKPYQKKRILTFLNPSLDPLGAGYNVIQSRIAVGSGGFFGKGFLQGTQNQLGFLPEKSTDFIFSVLAEEWGFIGCFVVLLCFLVIVVKGIQIAYESKDLFGSLLAAGITSLLFYHIVVNIGMAIGIMPVTGLLLPFISYGGSNLMIFMMCIGILNNIRMRKFAN